MEKVIIVIMGCMVPPLAFADPIIVLWLRSQYAQTLCIVTGVHIWLVEDLFQDAMVSQAIRRSW